MTTEKPYTFTQLICTLAALSLEGTAMVVGITWIALSDKAMGVGVAYLFTALIALFSVGMGVLQLHYYQKERYTVRREE